MWMVEASFEDMYTFYQYTLLISREKGSGGGGAEREGGV